MIALADASVALKWFRTTDEPEVEESQALLEAHLDEEIEVRILDLTLYEVANSLLRRHRWPAQDVDDVVRTLIQGHEVVAPTAAEHRLAAGLGEDHGLSFYDAAYAAVAAARSWTLVTADRELLDGFGRSATEVLEAL